MADEIKANISTDDLKAAIDAMIARLDAATASATVQAGQLMVSAAVKEFQGAHSIGMPHVGGAAPNTVTGNLQRSITAQPVRKTGAYKYSVTVGPRAIYSRIIELGSDGPITPKHSKMLVWTIGPRPTTKQGWRAAQKAGLVRRAKSVTIKPHPYMHPAFIKVASKMSTVFGNAWGKALNGG